MPKTFWDSYQAFLQKAGEWTGETKEEKIVGAVRYKASATPQEFAVWAKENGWGESYVQRHYLYVATYPEVVRELLRRGYPMRRIPLKRLDAAAVEQALEAENWRDEVERLFGHSRFPEWAERPVWLFESTPELRAREGLARPIAELLVNRFCPKDGLLVDPMAGNGELVQAARMSGRKAWGGDVTPRSSDIVQADIHDLLQHLPVGIADTLILHPPTFNTWSAHASELGGSPVSEHYAIYLDFIASLLQVARPVVKTGGKVVLIARPPRQGHVYLASFELALGETDLILESYHLAVSRDGREDWHFFIAQAS